MTTASNERAMSVPLERRGGYSTPGRASLPEARREARAVLPDERQPLPLEVGHLDDSARPLLVAHVEADRGHERREGERLLLLRLPLLAREERLGVSLLPAQELRAQQPLVRGRRVLGEPLLGLARVEDDAEARDVERVERRDLGPDVRLEVDLRLARGERDLPVGGPDGLGL